MKEKGHFNEYATAEMFPVAHLFRAQCTYRNSKVWLICIPGSGIAELASMTARIVHSNTCFQLTGVANLAIRVYACGNDAIHNSQGNSKNVIRPE